MKKMKRKIIFLSFFLIIVLIGLYFFHPNYIKLDENLTGINVLFLEPTIEFNNNDYKPNVKNIEFNVEVNDERYDYIKEIIEEQKLYHSVKGIFNSSGDERDIDWIIHFYSNGKLTTIYSNGNVHSERYSNNTKKVISWYALDYYFIRIFCIFTCSIFLF